MSRRRNNHQTSQKAKAAEKNAQNTSSAPGNDVSWYTRYPNLTLGSASIPYPYRPGMVLPLHPNLGNATNFRLPGIMALGWIPAIGTSSSATDPASLVARELYTKVRSSFSSSLDIDPPDLAVYLICLDSIFSYIGHLKRLYRAVVAYNPDNYMVPDGLMQALGCNPWTRDFIMEHRTRLFQNINELVLMTRKFRCPGEFDIFHRHYWMNDHVYSDDASLNSQFYVFKQLSYYRFAMKNTPAGVPASGAELVSLDETLTNYDAVSYLFNFGKNMIKALSDWDDAYTINGYLERAFADSPYFVVDELEAGEVLDISYDPEVLTQIENWHPFYMRGDHVTVVDTDISQDPTINAILYQPKMTLLKTHLAAQYNVPLARTLLNVRSMSPTLVDTLIASRLNIAFDSATVDLDTRIGYPIICGTEIPIKTEIWRKRYDSEGDYYGEYSHREVASVINFSDSVGGYSEVACFDWHPQIFCYDISNNEFQRYVTIFDIHNCAVIDSDQLRNIHRVCVLSEWNAFNA